MRKRTNDEYIRLVNEVHNGKYDYSKTRYVNKRTKICIVCPIHGEFWQCAHNHLRGQGCPECGKEYARTWTKNQYENFVNESEHRFCGGYSFPNIKDEYENSHSKVTIKCNKCGNVFVKIACDHLSSSFGGCQHCYGFRSKEEVQIGDYIKSLLPNETVTLNDRSTLKNYEMDIFIPSYKIAFEYNGLYWHSDIRRDRNYHLNKLKSVNKRGIKLIQIFEDEYYGHKDIVLSKIKHILKKDNDLPKIYARKCTIKQISLNDCKDFLNKNHIQGISKSTVYLGCFYNDTLCGVMSFKEEEKGTNKWELTRFATDINYLCIGVGGKLFKHFVREYNPEEVKSFADRRWTTDKDDNLYTKLGFKLHETLRPDYKYYKRDTQKRYHKFNFRKKTLIKNYPDHGLTEDMTETEMTKKIGAIKIWDCGLYKYIWKK